ncbi:MAG: hypothetical protein AB7F43_03560 [Bacteriovoracia bacterium]
MRFFRALLVAALFANGLVSLHAHATESVRARDLVIVRLTDGHTVFYKRSNSGRREDHEYIEFTDVTGQKQKIKKNEIRSAHNVSSSDINVARNLLSDVGIDLVDDLSSRGSIRGTIGRAPANPRNVVARTPNRSQAQAYRTKVDDRTYLGEMERMYGDWPQPSGGGLYDWIRQNPDSNPPLNTETLPEYDPYTPGPPPAGSPEGLPSLYDYLNSLPPEEVQQFRPQHELIYAVGKACVEGRYTANGLVYTKQTEIRYHETGEPYTWEYFEIPDGKGGIFRIGCDGTFEIPGSHIQLTDTGEMPNQDCPHCGPRIVISPLSDEQKQQLENASSAASGECDKSATKDGLLAGVTCHAVRMVTSLVPSIGTTTAETGARVIDMLGAAVGHDPKLRPALKEKFSKLSESWDSSGPAGGCTNPMRPSCLYTAVEGIIDSVLDAVDMAVRLVSGIVREGGKILARGAIKIGQWLTGQNQINLLDDQTSKTLGMAWDMGAAEVEKFNKNPVDWIGDKISHFFKFVYDGAAQKFACEKWGRDEKGDSVCQNYPKWIDCPTWDQWINIVCGSIGYVVPLLSGLDMFAIAKVFGIGLDATAGVRGIAAGIFAKIPSAGESVIARQVRAMGQGARALLNENRLAVSLTETAKPLTDVVTKTVKFSLQDLKLGALAGQIAEPFFNVGKIFYEKGRAVFRVQMENWLGARGAMKEALTAAKLPNGQFDLGKYLFGRSYEWQAAYRMGFLEKDLAILKSRLPLVTEDVASQQTLAASQNRFSRWFTNRKIETSKATVEAYKNQISNVADEMLRMQIQAPTLEGALIRVDKAVAKADEPIVGFFEKTIVKDNEAVAIVIRDLSGASKEVEIIEAGQNKLLNAIKKEAFKVEPLAVVDKTPKTILGIFEEESALTARKEAVTKVANAAETDLPNAVEDAKKLLERDLQFTAKKAKTTGEAEAKARHLFRQGDQFFEIINGKVEVSGRKVYLKGDVVGKDGILLEKTLPNQEFSFENLEFVK